MYPSRSSHRPAIRVACPELRLIFADSMRIFFFLFSYPVAANCSAVPFRGGNSHNRHKLADAWTAATQQYEKSNLAVCSLKWSQLAIPWLSTVQATSLTLIKVLCHYIENNRNASRHSSAPLKYTSNQSHKLVFRRVCCPLQAFNSPGALRGCDAHSGISHRCN